MHSLFRLPADVTRILVTLLAWDDVQSLTGVSFAAVTSDAFAQVVSLVYKPSLLLPPADQSLAQRLVYGLRGSGPQRLARFDWILVSVPETVDILLEPGVRDHVFSVRVTPSDATGDARGLATKICEKLTGLRSLRRLSVARTPIQDLTAVSSMRQLTELDLSHTLVKDASALAKLVHLQVLTMQTTIVASLACVQELTELHELRVINKLRNPRIVMPPLRALTKLQVLTLHKCSIVSVADLCAGPARTLCELELYYVARGDALYQPIDSEMADNQSGHCEDAPQLLDALSNLRAINSYSASQIIQPSAEAMGRLRSLRSIKRPLYGDLGGLATLVHLQELAVDLGRPWGSTREYCASVQDLLVLRQLPHLSTLKLDITGDPVPSTTALACVLLELRALRRLELLSFPVPDDGLAPLNHLEHLSLQFCDIKSLGWLRSFQSLRSLSLCVGSGSCNLLPVAALTQLESLEYYDRERDIETLCSYSCFAPLVNLRKLALSGIHFHNIGCLRDMAKLRTLRVCSHSHDEPTKNIHTLTRLVSLRELDIAESDITDLRLLRGLKQLRSVKISRRTDCGPLLVKGAHPLLLHVLHSRHNCLWVACPLRGWTGLLRRVVASAEPDFYDEDYLAE